MNINVLEQWKKLGNQFPKLSQMAKDYLAIPASSVACERLFSTAGNFLNKKRNRLKEENLRKSVLLYNWIGKININT